MRRPTDLVSWKGPYRELRDIWVGLYWTVDVVTRFHGYPEQGHWSKDRRMNLYICFVPCFPIHVRWYL